MPALRYNFRRAGLKIPPIYLSRKPLRPLRRPETRRILDRSGVFPQPVKAATCGNWSALRYGGLLWSLQRYGAG
jgi:hypothetical protein